MKARGVLRADLPQELEKNGTSASTAESVCGLLDELDAVRFTGASLEADIIDRARALMRELGKLKPKASHDSDAASG